MRVLTVGMVAVALVLAGCGGSDGPSGVAGTPSSGVVTRDVGLPARREAAPKVLAAVRSLLPRPDPFLDVVYDARSISVLTSWVPERETIDFEDEATPPPAGAIDRICAAIRDADADAVGYVKTRDGRQVLSGCGGR